MGDVSAHIERGRRSLPSPGRQPHQRPHRAQTIGEDHQRPCSVFTTEGRDHIWAYYTRNMVRPVALSRSRVDVVIGNPPWINYNQTADMSAHRVV